MIEPLHHGFVSGLEVVEADARGPARMSVIWLHGMGQDAGHAAAVAERLGLAGKGVRAVFPRAPAQARSAISGAPIRAWVNQSVFNLDDTDGGSLWATADSLRQLVDQESKRVGSERVVLAGFSQGAAMALLVALRHPERLGGAVLYAPFLFGDLSLIEARNEANAELPAWIGHGRRDWVVPCFIGEKVRDLLVENGHPVEWHKYPGAGHEAFGDAGGELVDFLDRIAEKQGG